MNYSSIFFIVLLVSCTNSSTKQENAYKVSKKTLMRMQKAQKKVVDCNTGVDTNNCPPVAKYTGIAELAVQSQNDFAMCVGHGIDKDICFERMENMINFQLDDAGL